MKKGIKIAIGVALAVIIAVLGVFSPYLLSLVTGKDDVKMLMLNEKTSIKAPFLQKGEVIEFENKNCGWFNYYSLEYTADCYVKIKLSYSAGVKDVTEEFFLEPATDKNTFNSFVDGAMENKRGNKVESISIESLTEGKGNVTIYNFSVFNR